jgi:hypothetical protein
VATPPTARLPTTAANDRQLPAADQKLRTPDCRRKPATAT